VRSVADGGNTVPRITKAEHIGPNDTGDNIEAKRIASYVWDSDSSEWVRMTQPTIQAGDVTIDGVAAFSDAGAVDRKGLVDADRHVQVDVLTSALPSGAATATKQDDIVTAINNITIDPPTGGATEDKQDDIITAIENIEVPAPVGGATEAEQEVQTALLTTIEANQLPDGHNVTVDNLPSEYPLPSAQVTALTPPAAITGFATSAKQDDIITAIENIEIDPPVGGATEAEQEAQTALLTTIESNQLPDGHNVTIDNASGAAAVNIQDGGNSITVDGTVAVTGTQTDALTDTQLRATAVPVSGTVTANLGTLNGAATAANQQTDALTDTELRATPVVVDLGANNDVTVTSGSITANAGTNLNTSALALENGGVLDDIKVDTEAIETAVEAIQAGQLPDGHNVTIDNPTAIASIQYTEGDTDTTITGNAVLWEDSGNTLRVPSSSNPLPVQPLIGGAVLAGNTGNANNNTQRVVLANNQPVVPISDNGSSLTVDGTVSITANSAVNVAQMNGVNTTMGNGASGTGVQRVTIASDSTGVIIARGAAATDAAVSGNPVYIGSRASTAEPTAMSADNNAVPFWLDRRGRQVVTMQAGTATLANVSGATSSTTLIAANTLRKGATIHNDSTAILYLKFGSAASSTSFTIKMFEDDYYEVPYGYSGIITGIWASATGAARCTEIS